MDDTRSFAAGVLGEHDSVKGFHVVATDGPAGRVDWATYEPGDSYLVVTTGSLRKKHHVVPAGAVTAVGDDEVQIALSREEVRHMPQLPEPQAPLDDESIALSQSGLSTVDAAAARVTLRKWGYLPLGGQDADPEPRD